MFKCDCCGQCCKNITLSDMYSELNRGDGVCKFFDDKKLLCTIYDDRPLKCRVDAVYDLIFFKKMTREEYYKINYISCEQLKKIINKEE